MGVYIKGMEMPENCALCPVWDAGNCLVAAEAIICEYNKRPPDCPLVPVPPHGRLVDVSEKIRVHMYDDMTEDYHIAEMTIDDLLSQGWVEADATTIIPAEEGE